MFTKHFTLEELTKTDTGLPNVPGSKEVENLFYLATYILEPIRERWGPVLVTSGYRSEAVNNRAGGQPGSEHLYGKACDIVIPGHGSLNALFQWILMSVKFGQVIHEMVNAREEWIHISLPTPFHDNMTAMTYDGHNYKVV